MENFLFVLALKLIDTNVPVCPAHILFLFIFLHTCRTPYPFRQADNVFKLIRATILYPISHRDIKFSGNGGRIKYESFGFGVLLNLYSS